MLSPSAAPITAHSVTAVTEIIKYSLLPLKGKGIFLYTFLYLLLTLNSQVLCIISVAKNIIRIHLGFFFPMRQGLTYVVQASLKLVALLPQFHEQ